MRTFTVLKKENNRGRAAPRFFRRLESLDSGGFLKSLPANFPADRRFWIFVVLWLLPLILVTLYTAVNFHRLPSQVPLYYSQLWGEKQLAFTREIYLPILAAFFLGVFDSVIALYYYSRDRIVSFLLLGASCLVAILVFITLFNIISLMR